MHRTYRTLRNLGSDRQHRSSSFPVLMQPAAQHRSHLKHTADAGAVLAVLQKAALSVWPCSVGLTRTLRTSKAHAGGTGQGGFTGENGGTGQTGLTRDGSCLTSGLALWR